MDRDRLPTGGSRPSLCVAYIFLGGTSAYGLKQALSSNSTYALGTFGFLLGHSVLGFAHSILAHPPAMFKTFVQHTNWLSHIAPLCLLNAELYTLTGLSLPYACAHLLLCIPPTTALFLMEDSHQFVIDGAVAINLASMFYLQNLKDTGVWTGGLMLLTALNQIVFKEWAYYYDVPQVDMVTIGLSFFVVFATQSLKSLKG